MKTQSQPKNDRREEGSALILAALITVILSLLGLSYTMMAQTENTIAENERNSAAALYAAEAGARLVVGWFNDPSASGYLVPAVGDVDRSKRVFDHDNNTGTARVLGVSGNAAKPYYKDSAFTPSKILDRPFRSALAETFLGIETGTDPDATFAGKGPDLIVNQSHLDTINNALFALFPSPNLRARITRIEIYAPPILTIGGNATRMGIATVKVTAGIFIYPGTAAEQQVATRIAKAVVNEVPIPGPVGPLQSCSSLSYTGSFDIHWGTGSAMTTSDIGTPLNGKAATGMPYNLNDPFTYINSGGNTLATWATFHNGQSIDDPWFKYITGGTLQQSAGAPSPGSPQPWPWTSGAADTTDTDHSNLFQNTVINCPTFDYSLWKTIAQSGMKNHYYYKYMGGGNFALDGSGTQNNFETLSNNNAGILFFDTTDGLQPDVAGTNLTPGVSINGSGWNLAGFTFLNAANFQTTGAGAGVTRTVVPPGEPFDGSGFVNLQYGASLTGPYTISQGTVRYSAKQELGSGDWYCTDASQCDSGGQSAAGTPQRDNYGRAFDTGISIYGVMYIAGTFTAAGNANYYGSVVAQRGVIDGVGNPAFYFDPRL
ncbi:MAG TPA: pilus assembly PilX N-terminal domain-containing protein, partial [Candidatus Polarisedimenticolia bacterium]|nr:pilus assembly PilX N-terminal domain-containing protein [Candidatus Polarisedimenticolia bacterium]